MSNLPPGSKELPRFAILDECTFKDERKNQWVSIDKTRLERLAKNLNDRIQSEGGIKVIPGHTVEGRPEEDQPRTVGFITDFRVEPFRSPLTKRPILKDNGQLKYALYATPVSLPGEDETFRKLNRRSPELWLDPDDIDPLALLGATTPRRDLGQHIFKREKTDSGDQVPVYFERVDGGPVFFREVPDHEGEEDMPHEPSTTAEAAGSAGGTSLSKGDIDAIASRFMELFMMSDTGKKLEALADSGAAAMPGEGGEVPGADGGMGMDGAGAGAPPGAGASPDGAAMPADGIDGGAGQGLEEEEPANATRMNAHCDPDYMAAETHMHPGELPTDMAAIEHGGHFWGEEPGWEDEPYGGVMPTQMGGMGGGGGGGMGVGGYGPAGPMSGSIPGYGRHHRMERDPYTGYDPDYEEYLRVKRQREADERARQMQRQRQRRPAVKPGQTQFTPAELARDPRLRMIMSRHQAEREADRKRIEALETVNREAAVDAMLTYLGNSRAAGGEGLVFDFAEEKGICMKFSRQEELDNYYASMQKKFRRQEDTLPNGGVIPVPASAQAPRPIQLGRQAPGRQDAAGEQAGAIKFSNDAERVEVAEIKADMIYNKNVDPATIDDLDLLQKLRASKTGRPANGVKVS